MARAFLIIQRDSSEIRLLLDSGEPFLNHDVELPFENACHSLSRTSTGIFATHAR